jgi:hypothetical protein
MILAPGAITIQALDKQIKINSAIERDIIDVANARPCPCLGSQPYAPVYMPSVNK